MAIDPQKERLYPLRIAVRFAPVSTHTGKPPHKSVLWRWARRGLIAADGARVHLETIDLGALYTSREALARFLRRVSGERPSVQAHEGDTDRIRRQPVVNAERYLDAAGI